MCAILTSQVTKLIAHISELHERKSADAIHDSRVAIRTINSHLETFSPFLRRKPTRELDAKLNWLNSKIANIRDIDVMIAMVEKVENEQVAQSLLTRLVSERLTQEIKLGKALESEKLDLTLKTLTDFALRPPLRRKFLDLSAKKVKSKITAAVSHTWVELFESLGTLPKRPKTKQLHRVRIAAKKCRYAYQAAGEAGLLQSPHIQAWTKNLQQKLGQIQDVKTLRRWVKNQSDLDPSVRTQALIYFENRLPHRKELLAGSSQSPK